MKYASYDTDFDQWVRVQLDEKGIPYIMEDTNTKITYHDYIIIEDNVHLCSLPKPMGDKEHR